MSVSTGGMSSCGIARGVLRFQATPAGHRAAGRPPRPGGLPEMEVCLIRHESIWHCCPAYIQTCRMISCGSLLRGFHTCAYRDVCPSWCTAALCLSPTPHACPSAGGGGGGGPGSDGNGGGRRFGPGYAPLLTIPLLEHMLDSLTGCLGTVASMKSQLCCSLLS